MYLVAYWYWKCDISAKMVSAGTTFVWNLWCSLAIIVFEWDTKWHFCYQKERKTACSKMLVKGHFKVFKKSVRASWLCTIDGVMQNVSFNQWNIWFWIQLPWQWTMVQGDIQLVQIMFDEPWDYDNDNGTKKYSNNQNRQLIDKVISTNDVGWTTR